MVRFSFVRDCGSIPHGDSTVSMFFSVIFSKISSVKKIVVFFIVVVVVLLLFTIKAFIF